MIRTAVAGWGLTPAALWAMTPREFAAALTPPVRGPLDRAGFETLFARYPDREAADGGPTEP